MLPTGEHRNSLLVMLIVRGVAVIGKLVLLVAMVSGDCGRAAGEARSHIRPTDDPTTIHHLLVLPLLRHPILRPQPGKGWQGEQVSQYGDDTREGWPLMRVFAPALLHQLWDSQGGGGQGGKMAAWAQRESREQVSQVQRAAPITGSVAVRNFKWKREQHWRANGGEREREREREREKGKEGKGARQANQVGGI
jgi:hypothetical protein